MNEAIWAKIKKWALGIWLVFFIYLSYLLYTSGGTLVRLVSIIIVTYSIVSLITIGNDSHKAIKSILEILIVGTFIFIVMEDSWWLSILFGIYFLYLVYSLITKYISIHLSD